MEWGGGWQSRRRLASLPLHPVRGAAPPSPCPSVSDGGERGLSALPGCSATLPPSFLRSGLSFCLQEALTSRQASEMPGDGSSWLIAATDGPIRRRRASLSRLVSALPLPREPVGGRGRGQLSEGPSIRGPHGSPSACCDSPPH